VHELSIAMSIVDLAEEESQSRGNVRVVAVYLRLGSLSGVVKDALLSSYEMACADTSLVGSRLVVEEVAGAVFCPTCNAHRAVRPPEWFRCCECGGVASEVVNGRELEITALEVES
jgi:hydrogenase nickel incorporation protein HypA/HybF